MAPNTGECIVNSPRAGEYIDFNYDQYDQFSQWSKNAMTKKKEKKWCVKWSVKIEM